MKSFIKNKICFILASLLLIVATSCKDDDNADGAQISFSRSIYILPAMGSLDVELRATVAPENDVVIPVGIEGTAVEGEDFTVEKKEFVLKAGETKATMTITAKDNLTSGREIRLSLSPTEGYSLGSKNVAMIPVETKEHVMYSFTTSYSRLMSEVDVWVEVQGETTGKSYRAPTDIKIPITVNSASTASVASDVEIQDDITYVTIKQNSRQAKFTVKIKDGAADYVGKNLILDLGTPEEDAVMYYPGSFSSLTVKLDQLRFTDMLGKWKPVAITNKDAFSMLDIPEEEWANSLPEHNNPDDYLEFVHTDAGVDKIIPHLTGDLTSYFCNPEGHEIVFDHIVKGFLDWATWDEFDIPYFKIHQVNKLFSKTKKELGDVFIGLDKVDDDNIIIYFHDYTPTDFFVQTAEDYGFEADYFGITYTFTRVK